MLLVFVVCSSTCYAGMKQDVVHLNSQVSGNVSRIDNNERRIGGLEDTEYNITGEVVILQGKRHKIGIYSKYDMRNNGIGEVGLRITFALGDSWETKEIEKLSKS